MTPTGLTLPAGRELDLPGRGTTFIREIPGPEDTPAVVLLHGWTVSADLNWFPAYSALAGRHRVIALDHRGHGRGIRSRRRFRLADCADDVAAVADALGLDRIVPVGYSMGGPISLLTWRRHRDLVSGMVLCATAPYFRGSRRGLKRAVHRMLPAVAVGARVTPEPVRRRVAGAVLGRRPPADEFARWAQEEVLRADGVAVAEAGAALSRFDARPWLAEVDVPTAVVRTTRDLVVPPSRQLWLCDGIPGARRIDVDADHAACVTAADRFVPALRGAVDHVLHG